MLLLLLLLRGSPTIPSGGFISGSNILIRACCVRYRPSDLNFPIGRVFDGCPISGQVAGKKMTQQRSRSGWEQPVSIGPIVQETKIIEGTWGPLVSFKPHIVAIYVNNSGLAEVCRYEYQSLKPQLPIIIL